MEKVGNGAINFTLWKTINLRVLGRERESQLNQRWSQAVHVDLVRNSKEGLIGSSIVGMVGAATYHPETSKASLQHLGPKEKFNAYAPELAAICLSATTI